MSYSMPVRLLLGALLVCGLPLSSQAAEPTQLSKSWEQWRGPNRQNHSADTGLLQDWNTTAPKLIWTATGLGKGYASVSIKDNRLFTTGNLPEGQAVIAINTDPQARIFRFADLGIVGDVHEVLPLLISRLKEF